MLDCVTQNVQSPQHTYMSSSCRFNRLGLSVSHWDPYAVRRGGCLELYYCNMVEWFWCDSSLISTTNRFLQCSDTVGLVIWPVKIVPEMTYYVSSGTLNPTHSRSVFISFKRTYANVLLRIFILPSDCKCMLVCFFVADVRTVSAAFPFLPFYVLLYFYCCICLCLAKINK